MSAPTLQRLVTNTPTADASSTTSRLCLWRSRKADVALRWAPTFSSNLTSGSGAASGFGGLLAVASAMHSSRSGTKERIFAHRSVSSAHLRASIV
eukprot:scaffold1786_cov250-Pinguiococcus_pyrenoidosus.AAC.6